MMSKHCSFIEDLYEGILDFNLGINHTKIGIVDSKTQKMLTTGNLFCKLGTFEHQGLFL